jgi:hypothetical protein
MGLLDIFSKPDAPTLARLVSGSFTIDASGRVLSSTLPQSFPTGHIQEIGQQVLVAFKEANKAQLPLTELVIYYSGLKLTARELRGGAIIFLAPQTLKRP